MKAPDFHYERPKTLAEAFALLADEDRDPGLALHWRHVRGDRASRGLNLDGHLARVLARAGAHALNRKRQVLVGRAWRSGPRRTLRGT